VLNCSIYCCFVLQINDNNKDNDDEDDDNDDDDNKLHKMFAIN